MKAHRSASRLITTGTREWADYNVNCINGCYNNCRYCYARIIARRFGRRTADSWKNMEIRKDILIRDFKKRTGRVMFPSTHDIFDFSPYKEACFSIIEKLLKSENDILITTKPRLKVIQEIIDQFSGKMANIQFRFTITSNDDRLLEFWEPYAPRFKERLISLQYAFEQGFMTSVSIEPFLDYDPIYLIEEITPFVTESIWIGKMNYIKRNGLLEEEIPYYKKIRRNYETRHLLYIYKKTSKYHKIRIKDSIRNQLEHSSLLLSDLNIS